MAMQRYWLEEMEDTILSGLDPSETIEYNVYCYECRELLGVVYNTWGRKDAFERIYNGEWNSNGSSCDCYDDDTDSGDTEDFDSDDGDADDSDDESDE